MPTGLRRPALRSVTISATRLLGRGYRTYYRCMVRLDDVAIERDVLKCGRVVGVLALDPVREEVVLARQFRLGAYLAVGECETLEIVAGRVDCEEDAADAARRECLEEIGVPATFLKPILELTPAPAFADESMVLFLAEIDAREVPPRAGAVHEQEQITVVRCGISDAIALMTSGAVHSAPTIIALQWLQLNRQSISTMLAT